MSTLLDAETLRNLFYYDPQTGLFAYIKPTHKSHIGDYAGRKMAKGGYIRITIGDKDYLAHRLAWLYMTGEWPSGQLDHIDCVTDNNRWHNLRQTDKLGQARNRLKSSANTSGFKGVSRASRGEKWRAQICVNRKIIWLGDFPDPVAASAAYQAAAQKYFGEFARF